MRNLKRALSLGLTAAMISGLMVMGSSAASYADVTSEDNQEAIEVLQAVEIMVGDENGDFNPDQNVTRNEMAVIMSNLMEYNVASYKDTSPFTDVPSWAEPYVAACWTNGITAGYSDNIYGGNDTVTTAQAALMLMKALGYFQYASDFGSDWQLATTRQGNAIDLFVGVDSGVTQAMTRNDVAQLVLNTLKAGTVQASTESNWTIGDVTIASGVKYDYITSNQTYARAIDDKRTTNNDGDLVSGSIVELGEQLYMGDLKLEDNDIDDFGRPARTWSYDGKEIDTYAKAELLVESYTTGVTGREMYDLLSAATIRDNDLVNYVDGVEGTIEKSDLARSNNDDLDDTGNGVLTEVYLDDDNDQITIASINTYLAQATSSYNSSKETVTLKIYENNATGSTQTVDVADVPEIESVEKETFYLVNMSGMNTKDNDLEVVSISDVDVMEDSTVTKFTKGDGKAIDKLTTGGTQYDAAEKAYYDEDTLNEYDASLLTDMSYNIYLDPYGYVIGVDLFEGTLNYVFITGYDRSKSNIAVRTAEAAAIFTDGTMDVITVNVKDTNDNIADYNRKDIDTQKFYNAWSYGNDSDNRNGDPVLNRWYTYTVNESGVYTLKPAIRSFSTAVAEETTIDCSNVRLEGRGAVENSSEAYVDKSNVRAYGEDASIFITVEQDDVDTLANAPIVDVTGVYTGVQDVELVIDPTEVHGNSENGSKWAVHTVYDKDNYIIASIVVGEAQGSAANYAYVLSTDAKDEEKIGDTYYWTIDVIMGGEIQTVTIKSKYSSVLENIVDDKDRVVELRFDGEYVIGYDNLTEDGEPNGTSDADKFYNDLEFIKNAIGDESVYYVELPSKDGSTTYTGELSLQGRTLYVTPDTADYGLTLTKEAKAVVIQDEYNKENVKTEFDSVAEALDRLADADEDKDGLQYKGKIVAILNTQGVAEWVVFVNDNGLESSTPDYGEDKGEINNAAVSKAGENLRVTWSDKKEYAGKTVQVEFYLVEDGKSYLKDSVEDTMGAGEDHSVTSEATINQNGDYYAIITITDSDGDVVASATTRAVSLAF